MKSSDYDGLAAARVQLVSYSARLLADGLAIGSAGNMSVRAGDAVAITPSGISYAEMRPEDVCVVAMDGTEQAMRRCSVDASATALRARSDSRSTTPRPSWHSATHCPG